MALKISLKPHERLVLGGTPVTVLKNGDSPNDLIIENTVPILIRGKDIMPESDATSPCRRIYFVIQLMYIDGDNLTEYHAMYWNLVKDIVAAAPSTLALLDAISEHIINNRFYRALKTARQLIQYEQELVSKARAAQISTDSLMCAQNA